LGSDEILEITTVFNMTFQNSENKWIVAYASVIGNGHIQHNIPCQDSCAHQKINNIWSVAVVCDGAGSAKHSHIGSDFIARNTAHCLSEIIERRGWNTVNNLPDEEDWRQEAIKALQIVMQRLLTFAKEKEYQPNELGTTVLATIYAPFALLTVHIGDGRAAYSTKAEEWLPLITPFRGKEANETVFITSGIWTEEGVKTYIATNIVQENIRAFALATDGCEKAAFEVNIYDEASQKFQDLNRPFPRFFEPNVHALRKLQEEKKSQEEINELWSMFLKAGTKAFQHEIDDKTLILAVLSEEKKPESQQK
jgi:hypothetical protein